MYIYIQIYIYIYICSKNYGWATFWDGFAQSFVVKFGLPGIIMPGGWKYYEFGLC